VLYAPWLNHASDDRTRLYCRQTEPNDRAINSDWFIVAAAVRHSWFTLRPVRAQAASHSLSISFTDTRTTAETGAGN